MFQCLSEFTKRFVVLFVVITVGITACAPNIDRLQRKGNVEKLLAALDDDQIDLVRMDAARALGELGAEEAIDPLITLLSEDEFEGVRSAAAYALGKIGGTSVIQPLMSALEDSSSYVRSSAKKGLAACGEEVVDPMIALLESEDEKLYQSAIAVLSDIGSPAVPELIELLSDDDDVLRQRVIEVLTGVDQASIALMVDSLDDDVYKNYIYSILLVIGEPAVDPLINALSDPDLRTPAGDVLMDMGEMVIDPLLEAYEEDPDKTEFLSRPLSLGLTVDDIQTRERVMTIFKDIGEPAIPAILESIKNATKIIVNGQTIYVNGIQNGAYGVSEGILVDGGSCDESGPWEGKIVLCQFTGLDTLSNSMESKVRIGDGIGIVYYYLFPTDIITFNEDPKIVSVAVSQETGETLLSNYLDETIFISNRNTSIAQEVLEEFGETAIPYLIEFLKDEEIRSTSSFYLVSNELIALGSSAVPAVVEMLTDTDTQVRYIAADILGQIDDDRVVEPLIEALEDDDPVVRKQAAYSLAEQEALEAIEPIIGLLDENEDVRNAAIEALNTFGLPAVEHLLDIYHNKANAFEKARVESALLDIFKANEDVIHRLAAKVCRGEAQTNTAEYDPNDETHPTVILNADGNVYWTYGLPVDWLPYLPEQLELVVCMEDSAKLVEECEYYKQYTDEYLFSINRYQYETTVRLYQSYNGKWLYQTTLTGSIPKSCPDTAFGLTSYITGSQVDVSDLAAWLSTYGIPLGE
jgi:HEAT repeat protein